MTSMLAELRQKKKIRDSKSTKEQIKPKQSEKPLEKILNFFLDRQASRLGVLYSLYNRNQLLEEPEPEPLPEPKEGILYVT